MQIEFLPPVTQSSVKSANQGDSFFYSKVNDISYTIFQQYSKLVAEKNFCFFSPCVLPHLSMLYAASPTELKNKFKNEFNLGNMSEGEWHNRMSQWTASIVSHVQEVQKKQGKPFEFKLTAEHAIAVKSDRGDLNQQAKMIFDSAYQAEHISFDSAHHGEIKGNQWIEKKTEGEIKNLVENLSEDCVALLLSAALFKGSWVYPFDKANTQKELFANYKGQYCSLDKMCVDSDDYCVGNIGKIRVIELPFHGDVSMFVFLPDAKPEKCVKKMDEFLTSDNLRNFFKERYKILYNEPSLRVALPRIELSEKDNLLEALSEWPLIQEIKDANFAPTLMDKAPLPIRVDRMVMQTNLTVDEEGAAIKVAMYTPCYEESCPPRPFDVNRPFAVAFFDNPTQSVLGMGRITHLPGNPLSENEQKRLQRYY